MDKIVYTVLGGMVLVIVVVGVLALRGTPGEQASSYNDVAAVHDEVEALRDNVIGVREAVETLHIEVRRLTPALNETCVQGIFLVPYIDGLVELGTTEICGVGLRFGDVQGYVSTP